jgi:hypothetical protein
VEGALFPIIIPEAFASMLAAYAACVQARSFPAVQWLALGWVPCLGRRTLPAVALASGGLAERPVAVVHRVVARAPWSLAAVGPVVVPRALRWLPAEPPVDLWGDDTLARKQGTCVSRAAMPHGPLLSTARKPFLSFGHGWDVLAVQARALVRRPARAAAPDRARPRSHGHAPGRSVLRHRPGGRRPVHLGSVGPPLVLGGPVP